MLALDLVGYNSLVERLKKVRNKIKRSNTPKVSKFHDAIKNALNGRMLLFEDDKNENENENLIIYSTNCNLIHLAHSDIWVCDGALFTRQERHTDLHYSGAS